MLMPHVKQVIDIPIALIERTTPKPISTEELQRGIDGLINSIKRFGLLQPVIVCNRPGGKYELIAGRRRVLAHVLLQAPSIQAVVLDEAPDSDIAGAIWATEELVRNDPNPVELADVMAALIKRFGSAAAASEQTGIPLDSVRRYAADAGKVS